jgi:hypothetical protein
MPRRRLTPEEREARRKARNAYTFSEAAYKHYDPRTEGYGSAEEWIRQAESIASGRGALGATVGPKKTGVARDLELLNLDDLPANIDGLKKAFRNSLFIAHPDYGGTNEQCRDVLAAFERLSKHYKNG